MNVWIYRGAKGFKMRIPWPVHPVWPVISQVPEMLPGVGLVTPGPPEAPDVRVPVTVSTLFTLGKAVEMVIVKVPSTKPPELPVAENIALDVRGGLKQEEPSNTNPETSTADPLFCVSVAEKFQAGVASG
jgi:hypothetical protein